MAEVNSKLGDYQILKKIGEGGVGEVYQAKDLESGEIVAVKVLRKSVIKDWRKRKKFMQEAKISERINHPNIVALYGVRRWWFTYYIVMEYVDGDDLKEIISKEKFLDEKRSIHITKQVGEALYVIHSAGIIHGDIKPRNILSSKDGIFKIGDFGIATNLGQRGFGGFTAGTPTYMSPEQIRGERLDRRSDIYSLGITFYEMLTGTVPFKALDQMSIMTKHINYPPMPPRRVNEAISVTVENVILKMLEKDPARRYADVRELIWTLDDISDSEGK